MRPGGPGLSDVGKTAGPSVEEVEEVDRESSERSTSQQMTEEEARLGERRSICFLLLLGCSFHFFFSFVRQLKAGSVWEASTYGSGFIHRLMYMYISNTRKMKKKTSQQSTHNAGAFSDQSCRHFSSKDPLRGTILHP